MNGHNGSKERVKMGEQMMQPHNPKIGMAVGVMFILLVFSMLLPPVVCHGDERINIERKEESTVYTISSGEQENEEEKAKERAWEMLNNMGIRIDKRGLDRENR